MPLAQVKPTLATRWVFVFISREQLSLPYRASEVYFVSEVIFDSEVSPNGEVIGKLNFTASESSATSLCIAQLHFRDSENFTASPYRPIYFLEFLWYNYLEWLSAR